MEQLFTIAPRGAVGFKLHGTHSPRAAHATSFDQLQSCASGEGALPARALTGRVSGVPVIGRAAGYYSRHAPGTPFSGGIWLLDLRRTVG